MWGVYTYRPPQKGVGPPAVRLLVPKRRPLTLSLKLTLVSHFGTRVPRQLSHCRTLAVELGVESPANTPAKRLA